MSDTALVPSRYSAPVRMLDGFGGSKRAACRTLAPASVTEMITDLVRANQAGLTVSLRGAGRSYGDASLSSEGLVLDLNGLDRILSWNSETGVAEVEPGVPLAALWRRAILDGFWPAVVPGTMAPTIGGMAAMNVHGKNQFKVGVFGEHVRDFDLVTPSGETIHASREENQDVFYAGLGSAGLLGAFSRISLQLKKVDSGRLRVESHPARNFKEQFEQLEQLKPGADYMVSWVDCFASGAALGRGQIHTAHHLHGSEDPRASQSLQLAEQELPSRILGFPKSQLWRVMQLFANDFLWSRINYAKYLSTVMQGRGHTYLQTHAAFAFLLDYVPNWRLAYGTRGLLQHQLFVPEPAARTVFPEALRRFQKHGVPSYLGVLKRHKADPFLLSHGVDGWSLALDFPIKKDGGATLRKAAREVTDLVLEAGGKFYLAKDQLLEPADIERAYGGALDRFFAIKQRLDPKMTMQTDQARRLFPERLRNDQKQ
jgi:decaprenylphospho-beta-D-ribofuranose 2-oxidase